MRAIIIAISSVVFLTGCADMFKYRPYAREVKRKTGEGGVIALHAVHQAEDRALAESMMRGVCGANEIKVGDEGEVVVGSKTKGNTRNKTEDDGITVGGLDFITGSRQVAEAETETSQVREWQISYNCVAKTNATGTKSAKK